MKITLKNIEKIKHPISVTHYCGEKMKYDKKSGFYKCNCTQWEWIHKCAINAMIKNSLEKDEKRRKKNK